MNKHRFSYPFVKFLKACLVSLKYPLANLTLISSAWCPINLKFHPLFNVHTWVAKYLISEARVSHHCKEYSQVTCIEPETVESKLLITVLKLIKKCVSFDLNFIWKMWLLHFPDFLSVIILCYGQQFFSTQQSLQFGKSGFRPRFWSQTMLQKLDEKKFSFLVLKHVIILSNLERFRQFLNVLFFLSFELRK